MGLGLPQVPPAVDAELLCCFVDWGLPYPDASSASAPPAVGLSPHTPHFEPCAFPAPHRHQLAEAIPCTPAVSLLLLHAPFFANSPCTVASPLFPADPPLPFGPLRDPDSVVLCLLAIDEEEEDDIALQIHFTLIQSFCCDNDINIMRVSGMQRLAQLLGEPAETQGTTEARDLHCLLVTVSWASALTCHARAPGLVFVNKVGLTGPAQLRVQPCLACPVGSRAGASSPRELF